MDQFTSRDFILILLGITSILISPFFYKPSTKKKNNYKHKLISIISFHIGEPPRDEPKIYYFPFRIGSIPTAFYGAGIAFIVFGIPTVNQFLHRFDTGTREIIVIIGLIILALGFKLAQLVMSKK